MAAAKKSTVYIDLDDEITSIIEKVITAEHDITALVLPKRASVFHSQVNVRLLKKAAAKAKKKIVLITSDAAVVSIAASTKVHIAASLSSKPEIPTSSVVTAPPDESEALTVGEAPENIAPITVPTTSTDDDVVVMDAPEGPDATDGALEDDSSAVDDVVKPAKKSKKPIKIPDFNSFRLRLGIGVGLVLALVVFWVFGFIILPKATVLVNTDISTVPVDVQTTFRVGNVELDTEKGIVPAERVQIEKIDSVTVPATGEKNIGAKAVGLMTLTNCIDDGEIKIIPAGTSFSSNNLTFVTVEAVTLAKAYFSNDDECLSDDLPASFGAYADVDVVATQSGPEYNLSARGYSSSMSGIQAYGGTMSGGSTQIIKVVSAADIEKAKSELTGKSKSQAAAELQSQLSVKTLRPISETLQEGSPEVVTSVPIDTEAAETKVTMTITYSMLGVKNSDIQQLVESSIAKSVADTQKKLRDNGMEKITFTFIAKPNEADQTMAVRTLASVGPEVDIAQLKTQIAGKKRSEIERIIEQIDGVRSVSVEYSPAWITTTPKSAEKITIEFKETNDN